MKLTSKYFKYPNTPQRYKAAVNRACNLVRYGGDEGLTCGIPRAAEIAADDFNLDAEEIKNMVQSRQLAGRWPESEEKKRANAAMRRKYRNNQSRGGAVNESDPKSKHSNDQIDRSDFENHSYCDLFDRQYSLADLQLDPYRGK